jgi:3',5'-cyclic-AMP phosphodiesterase
MFVFAHLSDVHLDGTDHIASRTARVMRHLAELPRPIDAVLVTGDIADHGTDAEYEEALKALVSPYPLILCPGNHDERRAYRRTLLAKPETEPPGVGASNSTPPPINTAHHVKGVTFAMCDSSMPGRDDGFLADETLDWLDTTLRQAEGPSFVGFHHPPVDLGQPFIDEIRMSGEERLATVVRRRPNVVALLCGHAHTAAATTFAGLPLLVAPGVKNTLRMPWESEKPMDDDAPPAFAFHILDDRGRLTTHYRVVS